MFPKTFLNTYPPHWIDSWMHGESMHHLLTVLARYGEPELPGWLALCRLLAQPMLASPSCAGASGQDRHYQWLLGLRNQLSEEDFQPSDWFNAQPSVALRAVAMARQACGLVPAEDPPLLSKLERHLLSHALANRHLTPQSHGALEMVVMLLDPQAGGNDGGRLAWLHLWRLDADEALGERLVRAPQAQALWLDSAFQNGLDKVGCLLGAVVEPNAPAVAWALQPLPLLSDEGEELPWGLSELGGSSLSVAMAVGCLYLLRTHLLPNYGSVVRMLGRLHPQALAITAQFKGGNGEQPPLPDPLQWNLSKVVGVGQKFHAFRQHQTRPEARVNRRYPMSQAWVAHDQDGCDGDGVKVGKAHTLADLLLQASQAHSEGLPEAAQVLLNEVLTVQGDGVEELSALQPTHDLPQLPLLPESVVNAMRSAARMDLPPHSLQALEQHLLRRLAQWTGGEHLQFQHNTGPVGITGAPVRLRDEFRAIAIDIPSRHSEAEAMRQRGASEADIREAFSARTLQHLLQDPRFGTPKAWVITADPAAGKTTILAEYELSTCWRALHRYARHGQWGEVALWVPLRQLEPLRGGKLRAVDDVMDEWLQAYAPAFGEHWKDLFDGPLTKEHGMVVRPLFDGVNELKCDPEQRDSFVRKLMKGWWNEARAERPTPVFTVRTLERSFSLNGEGRATLRPWDEARRNAYIQERLGKYSEQAENLTQAIKEDNQPSDEQKFYANPGMLALVCNLLHRGWIAEITANRAQLFACTLWMRLHDELHRTQDHPNESIAALLSQREKQVLNQLPQRMGQQLWVPPEQPGPLLVFLRDLAQRMQWPGDKAAPMMEITEDALAVKSTANEPLELLLNAAEALHLLVKEERRDSVRPNATVVIWRWAHQRWLEFWAAYGLTPEHAPVDLSVPEGENLEALYEAYLSRQRDRRMAVKVRLSQADSDGAEDDSANEDNEERFTLPAAPINAHEEVIAMAVQLRGQAVRWVELLLLHGNPELAARVALENWAAFGELRDHPQDGWQPEGRLLSDDRVETYAETGRRRTHPVLNRLRSKLLSRMTDRKVHITSRLRCGFDLGDLGGDGRFEICGQALILKDEHWVAIGEPGQTLDFEMGDMEGDDDEQTVDGKLYPVKGLAAFKMAEVVTTQAQYRCFAQSKDLEASAWWPDAAGEWLERNLKCLEGNNEWGLGVNLADVHGPALCPMTCNFWQAQAYALWEQVQRAKSGRSEWMVQLPTEAQWEGGARWARLRDEGESIQKGNEQGRRWSFAHTAGVRTADSDGAQEREEDMDKAQAGSGFSDVNPWDFNHNSIVGWLDNPVGVFLEGYARETSRRPDRVPSDLAGNVSEWCQSAYKTADGRFKLGEQVERVAHGREFRAIRGGEFLRTAAQCRVGSRDGRAPYSTFGQRSGFRLVLVVAC